MTTRMLLLLLMLVGGAGFAQQDNTAQQESIDARINGAVEPAAKVISGLVFTPIGCYGESNPETREQAANDPYADRCAQQGKNPIPFIVVWLIFAAALFTLFFRFINIRGVRHAMELVRGKFYDPSAPGEVTHFQALSTALSGTVGLGNIAGVAVAVSIGGPGATFWMVLAGFLGMSSKFVECTLGVKYRNINADGTVSGGPMYYLSKGLAERGPGLAMLGKVLAVMFAILCIGGSIGGGNIFQANQSFTQLVNITGGDSSWLADKGWLYGMVVAFLVGLVIIGGIKGIARVTSKIVPFMGIIYVIAGLVIIMVNYSAIPSAFGSIISGAFSPEGVTGGFVGVLIQGFRRAAFSNEAGVGSAAIAHSAVKTREPITEGLVALYEPFVDTVVVCTITALVIIITGSYDSSGTIGGVELTSAAFGSSISWFPWVLTLAVLLFAFSTLISWSYYGLKAWTYLFGESRLMDLMYKSIFLIFIIIGSTMQLGAVVDFSDAMILAMAFPNIVGLYFLLPVVQRELNSYWKRYKSGQLVQAKDIA